MSCSSNSVEHRLERLNSAATAIEEAIIAISSDGMQSYQLNTGQGSQTVTKHNLSTMQTSLDNIYKMIQRLEAKKRGGQISVAIF